MIQREDLIRYAITYEGRFDLVSKAVETQERPKDVPLQKAITIFDEEYPGSLRKLRYPPWVLFYAGNPLLLKTEMMTVIGSRKVSEYGRYVTKMIVKDLRERYTLVSGLAKGVDAIVHSSSMEKGSTIGVIGSGLKYQYPSCNQSLYEKMSIDHLVLSEYPYETSVKKEHFPWRNRILAALGKATIVTEAAVKSGTMLTVNEAMSLSKDVYVVPYPFLENSISGCNKLINDGALILYSMEQLSYL